MSDFSLYVCLCVNCGVVELCIKMVNMVKIENRSPTHTSGVSPSCVAVPPRSRALWNFYFSLTKQPPSLCQNPNKIKKWMLHKSLTHGYLFETRKQTISMEMQCLHAWQKSIICHFLEFLLHIACSVFGPVSPFFVCLFSPVLIQKKKKKQNKWCKCSHAWLSTSFFFLVCACVTGEITQ